MHHITQELDVRTIPPPQRHPAIFSLFDGLAPGEAFILINDHEPKPLLYQLQMERSGAFDWSPLEAGPERFRVEIGRRAAQGPRSVSEFLGWDHRRLDAIHADVERLVQTRGFAEAAHRFGEFHCGLSRHIEAEETILFPAFETMTGMTAGPTRVMRAEHVEIRRTMDSIAAALRAEDAGRYADAVHALTAVLADHNQKEEGILYPMTDRAAGDDRARDDLVRRMQAVSASGSDHHGHG
jgi:uncharacterized protein (DUF2249 family)/iron-sulfur cluster repair protein YtfE (RIC family)